jgi:hypothetical protein
MAISFEPATHFAVVVQHAANREAQTGLPLREGFGYDRRPLLSCSSCRRRAPHRNASAELKARAIHLELADRYDALVKGNPGAEVPAPADLMKAG